ncbi:YitT family protein [Thalassobius sp. Cn5-15]|uniref:YitT family protein n=1 Tax=Thalassobius sp. Cn5-15 TaxID=2917763 RepID=UPI001EF1F025|nr:YitT family protein [Thalassobius sp. Cn5-15]MCG7492289.1 YitT family protein [Thalassobius sp. Cn5-15]
MADFPNQNPQKHGVLADVQGFLFGTTMASFAMVLLTHLGLVTGQTAGLAVLLSYLTGYGFGPIFFVVNLPFYWLALKRMGWIFTAKTFAAIAVMSVTTELLPSYISFDTVNPVVGAVLVGMLSGMALLALFRHGASLGGVGILALYLQDKTGFRAGYTQLLFDVGVFAAAFFVIDVPLVLYSLLGAVVLNLNIAVNHRKDWYIAS